MPKYAYKCTNCNDESEHFHSFAELAENPVVDCEVCGWELRRVITPSGVVFKGRGWASKG